MNKIERIGALYVPVGGKFYYTGIWCKMQCDHSVLEQIQIKGSYLDQRLSQHESLYPIGLKPARIEIPHGGSHYIEFSKTDF